MERIGIRSNRNPIPIKSISCPWIKRLRRCREQHSTRHGTKREKDNNKNSDKRKRQLELDAFRRRIKRCFDNQKKRKEDVDKIVVFLFFLFCYLLHWGVSGSSCGWPAAAVGPRRAPASNRRRRWRRRRRRRPGSWNTRNTWMRSIPFFFDRIVSDRLSAVGRPPRPADFDTTGDTFTGNFHGVLFVLFRWCFIALIIVLQSPLVDWIRGAPVFWSSRLTWDDHGDCSHDFSRDCLGHWFSSGFYRNWVVSDEKETVTRWNKWLDSVDNGRFFNGRWRQSTFQLIPIRERSSSGAIGSRIIIRERDNGLFSGSLKVSR